MNSYFFFTRFVYKKNVFLLVIGSYEPNEARDEDMTLFDQVIINTMREHNIKGGSVIIGREGKILYRQGELHHQLILYHFIPVDVNCSWFCYLYVETCSLCSFIVENFCVSIFLF